MISPAVASHSGTVMRKDIAEEGRDVRAVVAAAAVVACCARAAVLCLAPGSVLFIGASCACIPGLIAVIRCCHAHPATSPLPHHIPFALCCQSCPPSLGVGALWMGQIYCVPSPNSRPVIWWWLLPFLARVRAPVADAIHAMLPQHDPALPVAM